MTCQPDPGAFTPENDGGGAFTVWSGRLHFCFDRGRLLRTLLVFVEDSALGRLTPIGAFTSSITVMFLIHLM